MTTTPHDQSPYTTALHLLESEWARLMRNRRVLDTVNSWELQPKTFWSLDEVLQAAGYRGDKLDCAADQVFAAIVRRAATDRIAARIALQRVLPPIVAIARRRGRAHNSGFDQAFGRVLSHAWEVIVTYPIERRPRKIAANIVRDTEYFAYVRDDRRRPVHESIDDARDYCELSFAKDLHGYGVNTNGTPQTRNVEEEVHELLQDARRSQVSERSLRILTALSTQSTEEFAQANGITARTARTWRRDAINELRERMQCAV
jgi:DNA-directed RNA polymerase specialized sigma24 family protein